MPIKYVPINILFSPLLSAVAVMSWSMNCPQTASITVKSWSSSYDGRCTSSLTCLAEGNSESSVAFLGFQVPAGYTECIIYGVIIMGLGSICVK